MHQIKKRTVLRRIGLILIVSIILQSFGLRNDLFERYYKSLKVIHLPILFNCQQEIDYPDYSNIPPDLDEKYRPMGYKTLGRIDLNKNIISIIQVAQVETDYPEIFSYKFDGTPIDTLGSFSGECSSFPPESHISLSLIDQNGIIKMTDTTSYFKLDEMGNRVGICDSVVIRNIDYKMDETGHFKMISNKKIKK